MIISHLGVDQCVGLAVSIETRRILTRDLGSDNHSSPDLGRTNDDHHEIHLVYDVLASGIHDLSC